MTKKHHHTTSASYRDKLTVAYGKALNHYCDNISPTRDDIEIIEGNIQRFYQVLSGRCSLQATLDPNMGESTKNITRLCYQYCNNRPL